MSEDTTQEQAAPVGINITDLAFLVQVVEVCSQRGAFRAEEMSSIGAIYDKVRSFIAANTVAAPSENTETTEEVNQ